MQNPGQIRDLAKAIKSKKLSPSELVQNYLDRIEEVQPLAAPWCEVNAEGAIAMAEIRTSQAKRGEILGPLHGIPFAVKDIIDVQGLPSRCNSKALQDRPPATADAEIVLALKAMGAIPLGKAHTTEFAFFDPSPARNPHNTSHTPGGSSSGSAAAVASGTVPCALGTQTLASLNRPAAYCGIAGFKPSTRSISSFGVAALAPSFDTVGFYGWSIDDVIYTFEALCLYSSASTGAPIDLNTETTVVIIDDPLISDCEADMWKVFNSELERFKTLGCNIEWKDSPIPFTQLATLHWTTMIYEAARALCWLSEYPETLIGSRLRKVLAEGSEITTENYLSARSEINNLRKFFFDTFDNSDVFYWPATPRPAPKGLESTGEPKYIAPWTTLGGPILTLTTNKTSNDLPLGCLLSGHPGSDRSTGAFARALCPTSSE